MRLLPIAVLFAIPLAAQKPSSTPFTPGMVITHSVKIRPGHYAAPGGDSAAITVRGSNVTVDLTGVELIGNTDREHPDQFAGTALRIDGGRNVTVKGLHARGYKIGIIARGVTRLSLLDNDLSYNWKPRLYSGIVKESLIDWLDYHQNEKDEWLRYGAGIYLADVTIAEIKGNSVVQGMNGLLMTRTTGARVWNNNFSFNSGLGVGMYRASSNYIMHNRIDYNVRGYSHGFYNRGQDSAGLLMYEQCSNNVVAYNSVTHGGDGLFLWAGQTTMDSGKGGANDNLFYRNDFSYAPTNGMEATFSRNAFVENTIRASWHGLWGGYSYSSVVLGNHFANNVEAIAIEHGQDNQIAGNVFDHDTTAIHLWWNKIEPSDWGYPKFRDTKSRDYQLAANTFVGNRFAMKIENTQHAVAAGNTVRAVDTLVRFRGDTAGWSLSPAKKAAAIDPKYRVAKLPGGITPAVKGSAAGGREKIIVDEWGPYDWKTPKLWPVGRDDATPLKLRVLGPRGRWRVTSRTGVAALSAESGSVGDTLVLTPAAGHENDFAVTIEYRGIAVTTPFGELIAAGKPVTASWSRFVPAAKWHVTFIPWDSVRYPRNGRSGVATVPPPAPLVELDTTRLDLTWYGPPKKAIPQANVITEANAEISLEPGNYTLRTISDDAVRVYVDGRLVIDDWNPGESHAKSVPFFATGVHRFRVVHLQLDGWYELRFDIVPTPR